MSAASKKVYSLTIRYNSYSDPAGAIAAKVMDFVAGLDDKMLTTGKNEVTLDTYISVIENKRPDA